MPHRIAYAALSTYPEAVSDPSVLAAVSFASVLGTELHVSTFAVDIPPLASAMGNLVINVAALKREVEARSKAECERLQALVQQFAKPSLQLSMATPKITLGAIPNAAAIEARHFDLALLPWSAENLSAMEIAQAIVFGSGRPTILVPPTAPSSPIDHIAIAWDGGRVAARALGDALALLAEGGRVSVLTVQDEKSLDRTDLARSLSASLEKRGYKARPVDVGLHGRTIAQSLQDGAKEEGARLLAMGGFGHSRLRDFILGGATKGVFADLQMPVLLAH